MERFHVIDEAEAIIRKGVVFKQVKLYRRGEDIFIPMSGGFIRVIAKFNDTFETSVPNIKLIDFEGPLEVKGNKLVLQRVAKLRAVK